MFDAPWLSEVQALPEPALLVQAVSYPAMGSSHLEMVLDNPCYVEQAAWWIGKVNRIKRTS